MAFGKKGTKVGRKRKGTCYNTRPAYEPQPPSAKRPSLAGLMSSASSLLGFGSPVANSSAAGSADTPDHDWRDVLGDKARRISIAQYYIDVLDAPPIVEWAGVDGTVSVIQRELKVNQGSRGTISKVLNDLVACYTKDWEYEGEDHRVNNGGANVLIPIDSVEAQIVADHMEGGLGLTQTTFLVNQHRTECDPPLIEVGRSAVHSCHLRLNPGTAAAATHPPPPRACKHHSHSQHL